MHEAYEIVPLLERLPLDIESLAAYDGNLVVGTRQGHLLMYSVGESGAQADVKLLRSNKNFSKKPITQVAVVPHYQILISLSDSIISIHDLTVYNFPLLSTMNNTKGASLFDLEIKHHVSLTGDVAVTVRLAVAVRRRVQLYYWKARHFHALLDDVQLTDAPQHLRWWGGGLVLDQGLAYCRILLDEAAGGAVPLGVECQRGAETRGVDAGDDALAVAVAGVTLRLLDREGAPGAILPLAFSAPPSALVYQPPLCLGVVGGRAVEVVSAEGSILLQTLTLPKPRLLVADVVSSGVSRTGGRHRAFCASLSHVWCLRGLSPAAQIPNLLGLHQYHLALRVLELWSSRAADDATATTREHIHKLHAFHLFCSHQYKQALDIFLEMDTELLFVVGLFPALVPEDCQRRLQYPARPPALSQQQLQSALACLIDYLLQKRQRLLGELDRGGGGGAPRKGTAARTRVRGSLHHQLQVVETTLLKCYLQERPSLVGPLLRIPDGRVSLAEGERLLREHNRLPDFLQLLRARGQHEKALALLHQHQHTTHPSPLKGPAELVNYLQNLGVEHAEILLKNSVWLVQHHPLEALRVFTGAGASVSEAEQLPRYRVAEFIKTHQPRLCILYLEHVIQEWGDRSSSLHNELVKLYRDVVIEETTRLKSRAAGAHLSACGEDLTGGVSNLSITSPDSPPHPAPSIMPTDSTSRPVPSTGPPDSSHTAPSTGPPDDNPDPVPPLSHIHPDLRFSLEDIRDKLLEFLRTSKCYVPATVLLCLPPQHECLLGARAVVLGALGQHRQALQLYVSQLHDLPAALAYCSAHYTGLGAASQVYLFLLELLIQCQDVASLLSSNSRSAREADNRHEAGSRRDEAEADNRSDEQEADIGLASSRGDAGDQPGARTRSSAEGDAGSPTPQDSPRGGALVGPGSGALAGPGGGALVGPGGGALVGPGGGALVGPGGGALVGPGGGALVGPGGGAPSPTPSEAAKFDILLSLLHTYAQYIKLKPAVQLLPDSLRVAELRSFLQSWLRQFACARRRMALQTGVARALVRQVTSDLCLAQSNKISLSSLNSCCICGKRLTRFSAFVCSPGGAVCHFSCRDRLHGAWVAEVLHARHRNALDERTRAAVAASGPGVSVPGPSVSVPGPSVSTSPGVSVAGPGVSVVGPGVSVASPGVSVAGPGVSTSPLSTSFVAITSLGVSPARPGVSVAGLGVSSSSPGVSRSPGVS